MLHLLFPNASESDATRLKEKHMKFLDACNELREFFEVRHVQSAGFADTVEFIPQNQMIVGPNRKYVVRATSDRTASVTIEYLAAEEFDDEIAEICASDTHLAACEEVLKQHMLARLQHMMSA